MPSPEGASETFATSSTDEAKNQGMWNLLPSFDPMVDDAREYSQKVRFLHGVIPVKDRSQLAPRLAMLCKGTAWSQVKSIDPSKLTDPDQGVSALLSALSSWEESEEMVTFEKFERAMYKICQKVDESTLSYVNRLGVAFAELGDHVTVKDFHAFILLRQSCLSTDDKKKILTMTGGKMETKLIDQAMRSLATKVLAGPNDPKKKIYPVNYTEDEVNEQPEPNESAWVAHHEEEDDWDHVEQLAQQGDEDALTIQTFEQDLEDLFQSTPDLQSALVTYQEARQKLTERKKFRGFWPSSKFSGSKGKGKGKKGFSKSSFQSGKSSLLDRISRTHCKLCGERGHWKAECPNKTKESVNVAVSGSSTIIEEHSWQSSSDVIFEETCPQSSLLNVVHTCYFVSNDRSPKEVDKSQTHKWMNQAISFMSHRINRRKATRDEKTNQSSARAMCDSHVESPQNIAYHAAVDGSYAVLDTGASRSVIGSELVPSLLKDLPAEVCSGIREAPSHVGFRFGNNEILHSHSQLQIPSLSGKKRVKLIVEVVPGTTPFLFIHPSHEESRSTN